MTTKKETNGDRIRAMSNEELAELLKNDEILLVACNDKYCANYESDGLCGAAKEQDCKAAMKNWLDGEAD